MRYCNNNHSTDNVGIKLQNRQAPMNTLFECGFSESAN